jgi:divalent metal cation (Fe/Co/Zn/Cd) transporter
VGFLVSAVALLVMGLFLVFDNVEKLVKLDHPPIGTIAFLGREVWLGWLMIGALVYTGVPAMILGRMKLPLARDLHDKVLLADAQMNKADWLTAGAAIVGIVGISVGLWWADAAAALFIAVDILRDGWKYVRLATTDLMDRAPVTVEGDREDPLPARVETELERLPWVREARVRMREEGHVFFGEAFVLPSDRRNLVGRIEDAARGLRELDWRLHDLVITPVESFEPEGGGETEEAATVPAEHEG